MSTWTTRATQGGTQTPPPPTDWKHEKKTRLPSLNRWIKLMKGTALKNRQYYLEFVKGRVDLFGKKWWKRSFLVFILDNKWKWRGFSGLLMGQARAGRGHGVGAQLKKQEKVGQRWKWPGEEHSNEYNVPSEDKKKANYLRGKLPWMQLTQPHNQPGHIYHPSSANSETVGTNCL